MVDIDVVGTINYLAPLGELVGNIDVVRVLSFLVPVFRGAGGLY